MTAVVADQRRAQRRQALKMANKRRREVADLKSRLMTKEVMASEIIRNPPPCVHDRLLFEVLMWQRGWREYSIARFNVKAMAAGINIALTMGRLTQRSRDWVADALEARNHDFRQ